MKILDRHVLPGGALHFEATEGRTGYRLRWTRAGTADLSADGARLRFRPAPGARPATRGAAARIARAYADSLRGRDSLHATALAKGGRAVAFIAPSGEGKSTFAAYLLKTHPALRLLTDDLLFIEGGRVAGTAPRLKLSPASVRALGFPARDFTYDPNFEKYILSPAPSPKASARLAAIVRLRRGGKALSLSRAPAVEAALTLQGHMYNALLVTDGVLRNQFRLAASLAGRIPVYTLRYPGGFRRLRAAAGRVAALFSRAPRG